MAIIECDKKESLGRLREKFNQLSIDVGDLLLLTTTEKGSIIGAVNELQQEVIDLEQLNLIRTIALS